MDGRADGNQKNKKKASLYIVVSSIHWCTIHKHICLHQSQHVHVARAYAHATHKASRTESWCLDIARSEKQAATLDPLKMDGRTDVKQKNKRLLCYILSLNNGNTSTDTAALIVKLHNVWELTNSFRIQCVWHISHKQRFRMLFEKLSKIKVSR